MFPFTRAQPRPIGLDVGNDSVTMLQLERLGDGLRVAAAARRALPAADDAAGGERPAVVADVIRQMLRQGNFRGRSVVAALPRAAMHLKYLRLPLMGAEDLARAVNAEAKNVLPFDPAEARMHFLPLGEVRHVGAAAQQEVVVLAAPNADVDQYVGQLTAAGVGVESLDAEPCALYRAVEKFSREGDGAVDVIVDVGFSRTLVAIGRGGDIGFLKVIDVGGRHLCGAVARKLGITPNEAQALRRRLSEGAEAGGQAGRREPVRQATFDAARSVMEELGREIGRCLRYYTVTFRGKRPTRLRLAGGEANDPQLLHLLGGMLPLAVEAATPLRDVDTSAMKPTDKRGPMSEWAMALGLALKGLAGTFVAREEAVELAAVTEPAPPVVQAVPERQSWWLQTQAVAAVEGDAHRRRFRLARERADLCKT